MSKKPNELMRRAFEVLLLVSILSLALSYLYSCLPCCLHSITSLLHNLNHFTTRKAMLLFSNVILLFFTIKGSAAISTTTTTSTSPINNPFDDDDHLVLSDSFEVQEHVVEKRVIEESVVVCSVKQSESSTEGNGQQQRSVNGSLELVVHVRGEAVNNYEVEEIGLLNQYSRGAWMVRGNNKRSAKGKIRSQNQSTRALKRRNFFPKKGREYWDFPPSPSKQMEVLVVEEDLDLLDIDELNKKFDEFIEREKSKRRLEAMQLILF